MTELLVLQAVRLKGRADVAAVAGCIGPDAGDAHGQLEQLVAAGALTEANGRYRITPAGRTRLAALLEEERNSVDHEALEACYHEFSDHNNGLKSIVTAWQSTGDGTPNDHNDDAYDQRVVQRLVELDAGFQPLVARIVALAPRLGPYAKRFTDAISAVQDGDRSFIARPLADSYHTVWFELHEELIGLLGRTRAEEATAGRAV